MVLELDGLGQTSAPLAASCVALLALCVPVCNMERAAVLLTSWGCGKIHGDDGKRRLGPLPGCGGALVLSRLGITDPRAGPGLALHFCD